MATLRCLAAVMDAASLRGRSLIESEGRKTPRSGCIEEKNNSMHQASSGSTEREAVVAHNPDIVRSAGARSSRVQESPLLIAASAREQEFRVSASHTLMAPSTRKPLSQSRCANSPAGSRLGLLSKALPNPSIKPSPGLTLISRTPLD